MRKHSSALALGVLLLSPCSWGQAEEAQDPLQVQTIAPGVHAALQPAARRFNDANSVLIFDPQDPQAGALVVDLPSNGRAADWWIAEMQGRTAGPVRFLVNTHWHSDHTQSNDRLQRTFPDLMIVGAATLRTEVPERAAGYLAEQIERMPGAIQAAEERLARGVDRQGEALTEEGKARLGEAIEEARRQLEEWRGVTFLPPKLTYPTSPEPVTLHLGGVPVELHAFRGHTQGDTVVYLPQQKILLTGDLLDDLPYGGHGYLPEWIAALEALENLDFQTLVPGHGHIYRGEEGRQHLKRVLQMFRTIHRAVQEGRGAGKTLEEVKGGLDLSPYRDALAGDDPVAQRAFDGFLPETVERAYRLATGEAD
jgi:glyoxylase-like metal-dependent hydrolase (beta-lactamase superfamily II)